VSASPLAGRRRRLAERAGQARCKGCDRDDLVPGRIDSFERIALADDPDDPNCGHYYLEAVYVMRCPGCGHRQEQVGRRTPFATLREAQTEMDAHLLGKG
jgi:Zn finger protein HypA/HybF involved in hydrogenase expression